MRAESKRADRLPGCTHIPAAKVRARWEQMTPGVIEFVGVCCCCLLPVPTIEETLLDGALVRFEGCTLCKTGAWREVKNRAEAVLL